MSPLFLGLDASTQALKASLLSDSLDVISELEIRFDRDLPHYKTKGGILHGKKGSGEVFSPVLPLVEAVDMLFEKIKENGWKVGDIKGVSAAGQQHASVYWSHQASALLSSLDASKQMLPQLTEAFSRPIIPNWQDSSTGSECSAIESVVGGPAALARMTGSSAHRRFTGPQIMRFRRLFPEAYEATSRISLVSSAVTTLLCADGDIKGIDESDACGMNLWDMESETRGWRKEVLEVVAGKEGAEELAKRLGKVETDGGKIVGRIGKWFVDRYGFNPERAVFPGTGDNPATFLAFTLRPAEALISLGTSDTVLVSTAAYNPHQEFHAFIHPAQIAPPSVQDLAEGDQKKLHGEMRYFNMLVYKNGSLAREHVRDEYYDQSWDKFNAAVEQHRPKSSKDAPKQAAFWWLLPDIIPANAHGIHKYESGSSNLSADIQSTTEFSDPNTNALSILESQLLNYSSRSSSILADASHPDRTLQKVYATGGAPSNTTICSLMADILDAPICKPVEYNLSTKEWVSANWNTCSVGVGRKAAWGYWRAMSGEKESLGYDEFVHRCGEERRFRREGEKKDDGDVEEGVQVVAVPGEGSAAYTKEVVEWWSKLEARALQGE